MILRDLDLLKEINRIADVTVCMTVTTLDERLWRLIEPTTLKPRKRLEAIARLREHGIRAGILHSPILPGLTDTPHHMESVVSAAAEYGASFLSGNVLRLGPGISDYYLPFIEKEFPELRSAYSQMYRGNYAPGYYTDTISKRLDNLRVQYRLTDERAFVGSVTPSLAPIPRQLDLFTGAA